MSSVAVPGTVRGLSPAFNINAQERPGAALTTNPPGLRRLSEHNQDFRLVWLYCGATDRRDCVHSATAALRAQCSESETPHPVAVQSEFAFEERVRPASQDWD